MSKSEWNLPTTVLFMALHGLLLWVVIPFGTMAWVFVHNWMHKADFDECLGWYDANLAAFVQRLLLRPIFRVPTVGWIPAREMTQVTHRVRLLDIF